MSELDINDGTSISGIASLLNQEKISNSINIEDVEKKLKSLYVENDKTNLTDNINPTKDIIEEYEQTLKEIESNADDNEFDTKSIITDIDNRLENINDESTNMSMDIHTNGVDKYYDTKTKEEMLQNNIKSVMNDVPNINFNMEQESEKEQKNHLLEVIESLKDDLEELGTRLDRIPNVSNDSSLQLIEDVHKRLLFKYNKIKYNSIAEEGLIAMANLLELIFDGNHTYFGVKPDVTGYSDVVKSKLKRIRFETSTAVSKFVNYHEIGIFPRIAMELLPSLITQSQRKRIQANDTINACFTKSSINQSISDLNQLDN